ncbi:universal stress protein [Amnibacterium kyonggiense]|uniref:Nucleotide-binding universal stress UspA family protein n=1 Tax=Amnibacterium kyonggiense TaxID=595671 RepID=A0A4R7FRK1_9MICO|nr:universal stress protein [Amnibacterium kyonggiense]TDS80423.1 nucleotide-binding universal stress UspA family protein [Amnibacterium kyonggiense]
MSGSSAERAAAAERVLLVVGGTEEVAAVAGWAAKRAARHPMAVTLVGMPDGGRTDGAERASDLLHQQMPSIPVAVRLPHGPVRAALTTAAADQDLVVLGASRTVPLTRVLPSLLAIRLAESLRRPVVLVPRSAGDDDGPVLVGVAGDGSDDDALRFAGAEAVAAARPLRLVHVGRRAVPPRGALARTGDEEDAPSDPARSLDAAAGAIRRSRPALGVSTALLRGEPGAAVVRAGADASLVVVGSRRSSVEDRVPVRSVGRALVEHPPCPIAVVPPARRA